ncbi:MAG: protein kinase [Planctomycetia bacterium]|nr:protein kinase [Planctomycetia bacterium]
MGVDTLSPGEAVGPYKVVAAIGHGGMGEVYRADEPALERVVALKVMSGALAQDKTYVERFRTEARAAASLVHPNVVNVFGCGEIRGLPYIAMEFVDGESLQQRLAREKRIPLREAVRWMTEAAHGLEAASRRGIVHRDIKPQNLLIDGDGHVKIADFGLAKKVDREVALTQTGVALGTPLYMSPEQGRGDPVDWRSDVYSLGATFYHAIAGRAPFEADSALAVLTKHATAALTPLNSVRTDVPPALSSILSRMLAKAQSDRYPSHAALIADLERVLPSLPRPEGADAAKPAPAPEGLDADDALLGRLAVRHGFATEQQVKSAAAMQAKMKAAGKAVRRLDEILVAAKLITPAQAASLKDEGVRHRAASEEDAPEDRGPANLEVTEVGSPTAPGAGKTPSCPLCRLAVRPDQVQQNCPECGTTQHSECMANYGGCGNEKCPKSPKSMSMAALTASAGAPEARSSSGGGGGGLGKLVFLAGGAAVLAAAVFFIYKAAHKSAQDLYDEAKTMDTAGGKGRLSIFSIDETNKDVSAGSGLSGETRRRLETQMSLYRRALEQDSGFLAARIELASCLAQLGRKPEALKEYEAALGLDPSCKEALLGAGSILFQEGDFSRAEPLLQKAAEAGTVDAWLTLAVILQDKKKDGAKAVAPLRKYLGEKGDDGNAWSRLALAQLDAGDEAGAVNSAEKAIQKGTSNPGAHLVKAKIAFKNGRYEEAAKAAMESAEKVSQGNLSASFEARKLAGRAFAKAGRPQPAREQLTMAKSANSGDVEVLLTLGDLAKAAGDWNDAGNNYKMAYDAGSGNLDHLFEAGYLFYLGSNAAPAASAFEAVYRKQANYKDLNLWLARAYILGGSLENATPAVARALEEKPDDPDRKALRVREMAMRANLDGALTYGIECLDKHPGNGEVHFALAFVYERGKNYDKAREHLTAAAETGLTDALYECADFCQRFGDRASALKYFKTYLEKAPIGYKAETARQMVLGLTSMEGSSTPPNPGSTTGWTPPPAAGWEYEVKSALDILDRRPATTEEPVDRAYFGVMAGVVCASALGERYEDVTAAHLPASYAAMYLGQDLRLYVRSQDPTDLAVMRAGRIKTRFAEIGLACDGLVRAFAAAAGKLNPGAAQEIKGLESRWNPKSFRDDFERLAGALDLCVSMVSVARGPAAAPALEKHQARTTLAENPTQRAIASAYALAEMLAAGMPEAAKLLETFENDDEACDSGLSQLALGLYRTARILSMHRKK